jgi:hypothetical protein
MNVSIGQGRNPQIPLDVAIVIATVLRSSLARAYDEP